MSTITPKSSFSFFTEGHGPASYCHSSQKYAHILMRFLVGFFLVDDEELDEAIQRRQQVYNNHNKVMIIIKL